MRLLITSCELYFLGGAINLIADTGIFGRIKCMVDRNVHLIPHRQSFNVCLRLSTGLGFWWKTGSYTFRRF